MAGGLVALLDDIAALAKLAAASLDDVAGASAKAGSKAVGVVIDDTAVTPRYVTGLSPARELPIIWKIALGSLRNKLIFLLPAALVLSAFAPWAITPILMAGGAFLCFEGAEKIIEALSGDHHGEEACEISDPKQLEDRQVAGAIRTDLILSGEIMAIALASVAGETLLHQATALAIVAVAITAGVYGVVALIVKMDDVGLAMARRGSGPIAALGRGIVKLMPKLMAVLTVIGTAAMIWVGGNIVIHGLHELGYHTIYEWIHHQAEAAAAAVPQAPGFVRWFVTAFFDGIFGLILGLILIPLSEYVIVPVAKVTVLPVLNAVKSLFGRRST